ncbi:cytochrome b/b6 domain-containing protein [Saccharopolyspora sp. NPDC002376]
MNMPEANENASPEEPDRWRNKDRRWPRRRHEEKEPLLRWPWGQRALARIRELRPLLEYQRRRTGMRDRRPELDGASDCLNKAEQAILNARRWWLPRWPQRASAMDRVLAEINAARLLVVQAANQDDLRGMLFDLAVLVEEHLPKTDRRRVEVEKILQKRPRSKITESERRIVVDALRAAYDVRQRKFVRVRSFVRIVHWWTAGLVVAAAAIGYLSRFPDGTVPLVKLCFPSFPLLPSTSQQSPPRLIEGFAVCPTGASPGVWDYAVVEAAGCSRSGYHGRRGHAPDERGRNRLQRADRARAPQVADRCIDRGTRSASHARAVRTRAYISRHAWPNRRMGSHLRRSTTALHPLRRPAWYGGDAGCAWS